MSIALDVHAGLRAHLPCDLSVFAVMLSVAETDVLSQNVWNAVPHVVHWGLISML